MANTPDNILRYVTVLPGEHWLWNGPLSRPAPRICHLNKTLKPRPEIFLQNHKTVPQRVFFETPFGRPPQGPLWRIRSLCELDLCVSPYHFQERCTSFLAPLDEDHEAYLQSLQSDIDNGVPFNPSKYGGLDDELLLIGKHYPHIAAWMARSA